MNKLNELFKLRNIILRFIIQDFKTKYIGNGLGILWAFIQPLITICIFWFVFQIGFKSTPVSNVPFILWFITGIIPWFFITDSIINATNSIVENSFLVKKIVFRVELLPVVKILAGLIVHIFFVFFMFVMYIYYGYTPTIYWVQLIYYILVTVIFLLMLSWFSSSIIIFLKDTGQIINMFVQFGFWATPIFWSYSILPSEYMWFVEFNPIFYIIEGYRDCMINNIWFWEKSFFTLYFWILTLIFLFLSIKTFKKLRPHFADVL